LKFVINERRFENLEEWYRYYHGWDSWPRWPHDHITGEDAAVNTPEALGFYDRKEKENELATKNDDREFEPSGN
jgi:hypothetical protein